MAFRLEQVNEKEHQYLDPSEITLPKPAKFMDATTRRFTPAALEHAHAPAFWNAAGAGIPPRKPANAVMGLRGDDERATYNTAKRTLAVVVSPPSAI